MQFAFENCAKCKEREATCWTARAGIFQTALQHVVVFFKKKHQTRFSSSAAQWIQRRNQDMLEFCGKIPQIRSEEIKTNCFFSSTSTQIFERKTWDWIQNSIRTDNKKKQLSGTCALDSRQPSPITQRPLCCCVWSLTSDLMSGRRLPHRHSSPARCTSSASFSTRMSYHTLSSLPGL